MKAWVIDTGFWSEYQVFVHAETRGKAKYKGRMCDPGDEISDSEFTDIKARRYPEMDGVPFESAEFDKRGIYFEFEGEPFDWTNECDCEICKGVK